VNIQFSPTHYSLSVPNNWTGFWKQLHKHTGTKEGKGCGVYCLAWQAQAETGGLLFIVFFCVGGRSVKDVCH